MARYIFLDSAPLSLLANPAKTLEAQSILRWTRDCDAAGHYLIIPEIVDYEVRRELLRANKRASIVLLDGLQSQLGYLPLTTTAVLKAAELWAQVRQSGRPTASDANIDVDVILAAQALTAGVPHADLVIATSNPRHLSLFVNADIWTNIAP